MRTLKLLVGVGVMIAAAYLAYELVPPFFANYQFEDAIQNEAMLDSYANKNEDDIRNTIFKKAQDLQIPITIDQVKVQRIGSGGSGSLAIWVDYSVHVDLPYYPLDLQFHPASKNRPIPGA